MSCLLVRTLPAAELRPDDTIEIAMAKLANVVDPRHKELTQDRQAIIDVIDDFLIQYADMRGACRVILSNQWKTATTDQRTRFIEAFNNHVSKLLVDLIPGLDFDTVSIEPFEGDLEELPVRVRTTVRGATGDVIRFDFLMHNKDGDWRILDVIAEGVSYLKLYRSEFKLEITEKGLEQVIERFAQKSAL